ncbi:uncharacterized protein ARMOST_14270 [Armillaria ostoyae]|uniref:Uncharacterized protein n=1 Tax=Armillaria ostoyae TaxID=47428 RepID=A0A284RQB2_ARMOS|nr:uncharacterized protein ARMOST_14270 [Armillaria ostoyae]
MTPDLTNNQTIAISTALVGACLIFLLGFFVALAWREKILPYLYQHGILIPPHRRLRPQRPAPFPTHYILPYANSEQSVLELILAPETGVQHRTGFHANSSDEFPQRPPPPQRNTTPGPSGTRQTPTPPPDTPEPQANDRDIWARYEQFPPPAYDPTNLPPPERAFIPIQPRSIMGFSTRPVQRIFIRPAPGCFPDDSSSEDDAPWNRTAPPAHELPPPNQFIIISSDDEDLNALEPPQSDPMSQNRSPAPPEPHPHHLDRSPSPTGAQLTHSISTASTLSGTNSPRSTFSSLAPTALPPGSYDDRTSRLDTVYEEKGAPQWAGTSQSNERTQSHDWAGMQPSQPAYSTTETKPTTALPQGTYYKGWQDLEWPESSSGWSSPYLSWPLDNEMRTLASSNQFDTFHYDSGTFGRYAHEFSEEHHIPNPQPLPDAPCRIRQHSQYHGPRTSHLIAGTNDEAGGSNNIETDPPVDPPVDPPTDPSQPSNAERLQLAMELAERKAQRLEEIRQEVEEAEQAHDEHIRYYNLPLPNQSKGKDPERGRAGAPEPPPEPNWQRLLNKRDDR